MKIGILGGTFDPIHLGHLELAKQAKRQFQLDKILFMPAFIPPHKSSRRDITPAPYRLQMVEKAVESTPGYDVSKIEFNRPDISYTVDTLRTLKEQYPEDFFYLIIGSDALSEFSGWKDPQEIRKMATLLVAVREPVSHSNKTMKKESGVVQIMMPFCPFSSSEIRARVKEGKSIQGMVSPEVERYIYDKRLYQVK